MNKTERLDIDLRFKTGCYYTSERNKQIIIYLLKKYGINKIVVSPGATNFALVGSMQHDPYFEMYSCVDERAAAYMAIGMAEKSGEPIVLSCTGATASRNYMAALTYAFKKNIPIFVITSSLSLASIGHLRAQVTDRTHPPVDMIYKSYNFDNIKDSEDEWNVTVRCNEAINVLKETKKPVLLNVCTTYSLDFSVKELPNVKYIPTILSTHEFPSLPDGEICIFIGSHQVFTKHLTNAIELFCEKHNAVIFCDHTSGYNGKYKVNMSLVFGQEKYNSKNRKTKLLIHIGEISGDYYTFLGVEPQEVWRVNIDGAYVDFFHRLTKVFKMPESEFFDIYNKSDEGTITNNTYYAACKQESESFYNSLPDVPFSNIWIAKQLSAKLPKGSQIHIGILNSLRSWDFFNLPETVEASCNVGGFGIDGCVSSLIGAALANPAKMYFGVVGDLTFYYDSNILLNINLPNNIRLIVVNNGRGTEFRNYCHPATRAFNEAADPYIAAAGHFGNQINSSIANLCDTANIEYFSVSNKDEYLNIQSRFISNDSKKAIIIEAFTTPENESNALMSYRQCKVNLDYKIRHNLEKHPFIRKIILYIRKFL